MHESLIGGQLVYPLLDDDWQPIANRKDDMLQLIREINTRDDAQLYVSIALGGLLVFGGNEVALKLLEEQLTPHQRFPMRLHSHAAFHTPLQQPVAQLARTQLSKELLRAPEVPLIDGQGQVWTPWSSDPRALWDYTFDAQICQTYDFTKAVQIAVKTFAPDCLIVTGPGNTLGGAIAQSLIEVNWQDLDSKLAFSTRQKSSPYLFSMGLAEQRSWVS
jgi:[acyl-carrier-protein] S-malonyltransferase